MILNYIIKHSLIYVWIKRKLPIKTELRFIFYIFPGLSVNRSFTIRKVFYWKPTQISENFYLCQKNAFVPFCDASTDLIP